MPPKPVSIEAAKTHREAMKVRRIQEAAAEEKGLPNGWEGVEADTSFDYDQWVVDNAEPFKFSCSPLELSELGPGVVLYFDLVKYLGVLMFCFSALHLVAIYFNSEADVEILEATADMIPHSWYTAANHGRDGATGTTANILIMVEILSSLLFSFSLLYYTQHQRFREYAGLNIGSTSNLSEISRQFLDNETSYGGNHN